MVFQLSSETPARSWAQARGGQAPRGAEPAHQARKAVWAAPAPGAGVEAVAAQKGGGGRLWEPDGHFAQVAEFHPDDGQAADHLCAGQAHDSDAGVAGWEGFVHMLNLCFVHKIVNSRDLIILNI